MTLKAGVDLGLAPEATHHKNNVSLLSFKGGRMLEYDLAAPGGGVRELVHSILHK